MVCQPLRLALLIGAITAVAVSPVRANFRAPRCSDPCGTPCAGTTAPAFRTVTCTEWVRENVTTTRKAYKVVCRTVECDSWRTECVPVCKERTVCVTKRIPEYREECRKVCKKETTWETRPVTRTTHKYVQETVMKKQLVRLGHWDCKEVPALFGSFGNGGGLFGGLGGHGGHGHHRGGSCDNACADPCPTACPTACETACRTRTRKVWVSCPEYRECPTTVCKKVCVNETVNCKVAVCKDVWCETKVKVCTYRCVQEQQVQKYTCYETRKVACKVNKTVRECVPYDETVTCCKLVPKTVTRQVPCAAPCAAPCTTNACSSNDCCESEGWFAGFRNRLRSHGHGRCKTDCGTACPTTNDCCESEGWFAGFRSRMRHNGDCCRPTSCCK